MCVKLMTLMHKIGNFLGITPLKIDTATVGKIQKWYNLFILLLFTIGAIISIASRRSIKHGNSLSALFFYSTEIILYAFTFYTTIVSISFKRLHWYQFYKNLQIVKCPTQIQTSSVYTEFFIIVICSVGTEIMVACALYQQIEFDYFRIYFTPGIQLVLQTFYKFFLYTAVKMLHLRYTHLTHLLSKHLNIPSRSSLVVMRQTTASTYLLQKTVNIFNDLFGWPISFFIYYTILSSIEAIYNAGRIKSADSVLIILVRVIPAFTLTMVIILMCQATSDEAKKILRLAYELRSNYFEANSEDQTELHELTKQIKHNLPKFLASGYGDLGKPTILNILATIISFLIFVLQLPDSNNR